MKKILLWFSLSLLLCLSTAFVLTGTVTEESATATITVEELKDHLFYLASDELEGRRPGTRGYRLAAEYAANEFRKIGLEPILKDADNKPTYLQPFQVTRYQPPIETNNVVGAVIGSDPVLRNEYITFGVHLDHIGVINDQVHNGADDNAASCAALLEVAEAIARSPVKRSVIFILYSAEEMGLLGSKHFVDNPPVPLDQIVVNINMEMIGRPDPESPKSFTFIGADAMIDEYPDLLRGINSRTLNLPIQFLNREDDTQNFFRRSDHYRFHEKGIPAVVFGSSMHEDYHRPTDDPEKIDLSKVHDAALLSYYITVEFGTRSQLPEPKPVSR